MRAQQILLEYNAQGITRDFFEKFMTKWTAEGKPFVEEIGENGERWLTYFDHHDPTNNNKYVKILVQWYAGKHNGLDKLEDLDGAESALIDYDKLATTKKLKPEHAVINKIKSINELESILTYYRDLARAEKNNGKEVKQHKKQWEIQFDDDNKAIKEGHVELKYDGPKWRVVRLVDMKGATQFAKLPNEQRQDGEEWNFTSWCTKIVRDDSGNIIRDGTTHFENYIGPRYNDPDIYTIVNKLDPKERYQFHWGTDQFRNTSNNNIKSHMSFLAANPDLLKLFASEGKEVPRKLENGGYHIEEHGHEEFLDNKGRRHKVDGYAYKDDTIEISYDHGKLHSWNDNPVKVHSSGKLEWVNERDERHRDGDKPAVKGQDGSLFWYNNEWH